MENGTTSKRPKAAAAAPRKRGRSAPPLRLAWPAAGDGGIGKAATLCTSQSQSQPSFSQQSSSSSSSSRKRRASVQRSAAGTTSTNNSSLLWVDKYAPRNDASQLCVAPKKVTEVKTWIESALAADNKQHGGLLILVGSPGIGKSTMVRVLASELQLNLQEWNDSYTSRQYYQDTRPDALLSLQHSSALDSFQQFLNSAGAGYQSLCTNTKEAPKLRSNKKRKKSLKKEQDTPSMTSLEGKSLILLEELPNLYSDETEARFREIMGNHIQHSLVPTILIFSDVCEGKHKPIDLERLVPSKQLYSESLTRILQCHPVTKAKLKKCLKEICKREGISIIPNDSFWEEVYLQSKGDVRHAIMSLQYQQQSKKTRKQQNGKGAMVCSNHNDRDTKLSTFHALGKVLYAKRQKPKGDVSLATAGNESELFSNSNNPLLEKRRPLEFNPELVMEQSDMGLGGALSFLGYHSPEFFTDSTDLSVAFGHFSDAAVFLEKGFTRDYNESSVYPNGYAASLAGRAVANGNRHPAPNKFRSFTAPKVFEVMRKRKGNDVTMKQLCKRLSNGGLQSLDNNLGSSRRFVIHDLPFMRAILPHEVNSAVDNLYSNLRPKHEPSDLSDGAEDALKVAAEEQRQILAMDDIVEESSSDDDDYVDSKQQISQSDATTTSPTSTVHDHVVSPNGVYMENFTPLSAHAAVTNNDSSVSPEQADIIVIDD